MRKRIALNASTSILLQIISIIIGLVIPRLMIQRFGSSINGLIGSITQFISYITLFEAGLGGVVRAVLYKPLADQNYVKISAILRATDSYFKKMGLFFLVYVTILSFVYPLFVNRSYGFYFTNTMIWIISINIFSQYFIGITYSIFLNADAKNYVLNIIHVISVVFNAIFTIVLLTSNASVHMIKAVSALVYTIKPVLIMLYVSKKYKISKDVLPDYTALSQKRSGLAHHVAWFLHTNTDVVVITLFGRLGGVSVYSVYYMVVSSVSKIVTALVNGIEAVFGKKMVSENRKDVQDDFGLYCMIMNSIVIILFFTAGSMLMPFIKLYTLGINDENYYIPLFGYFLLAAEGVYCLRIPYHGIVTAAGHFRQTQKSAIIEASINVVLSIVLINVFGILGVAIATLFAMMYRTIFYIAYLSKNILEVNAAKSFVNTMVCIFIIGMGVFLKTYFFSQSINSYAVWVVHALLCFIVGIILAVIYDLIFFRREMRKATKLFIR